MKTCSGLFLCLAVCVPAEAALVAHFRLEEGATDPFTNTVNSTIGGWTGAFQVGTYSPQWVTSGLAPVPASEGGSTAALLFDTTAGTDPYVLTDYPGILGSNARTYAAWIKASTNQPNFATIIGCGDNTAARRVAFRLDPSGFLRLEISGSALVGTVNKLNDEKWHHVAATLPTGGYASNFVLYVDGNIEPVGLPITGGGALVNTTVTDPSRNVAIANSGHSTNSYGFNGVVDDVRVYDTNLSQSQILAIIYGAGNPPAFTLLPQSQKATLGATNEFVTFNFTVSGSPPLSFQWKKDGAPIPGETSQNLTLGPISLSDLGSYTVTVTNTFGSTNSPAATLSWGTPPLNPVEQAVLVGGQAVFSVTMPSGSSGYSYQWRKGSSNIPGATDSTYALTGATLLDSTNFSVQVTLAGQTALSDPAQLRVLTAPASAYATLILQDSPSAYWRLGETTGATTAADQTGFHPGAYLGGGDFLGQLGAITNDSNTSAGFLSPYYIEVPYSPALNRRQSFSLEAWAKPSSTTGRQSMIASRTSTRSSGYELLANGTSWQFRTGASDNPTVETWNNLNGGTVTIGEWHHVAATYDGVAKRLYVNGALIGEAANDVFASPTVLRLGANQTFNATPGDFFNGDLDEVAVYWRALSPDQVRDHYLAGVLGGSVPPEITSQPVSQTIVLGDPAGIATFTVLASGSPRLAYQWSKNGAPLPGATGAILQFDPATGTDIGTYSVTITNVNGSITSSNVTLSYVTGPITPGPLALLVGDSGSFTVNMPEGVPYTYQWKRFGTNLPGQTASTISFVSAALTDTGTYSVVVTFGADSVESAPVTLTVLPLPSSTYSAAVTLDSPVAWWRLNEPAGSFVVSDAVGGFTGSSFSDVVFGTAGALLGDTDTAAAFTGYSAGGRAGASKVDVPYTPSLNPATFTVECWALLRGGSGLFRSPVTSRESAPPKGYLFYAGTDDRWQFWIGDGTAWNTIIGPAVVEHEWTHLVGTYDGANMALYVNGALIESAPAAFLPNELYGLRIGAGQTEGITGNFFFPGVVDEVAVYNGALSAARVQAHYAAGFQAGAPPRLTLQPLTRSTLQGEAYTLSGRAHAAPPLQYQWRHAGTNLPGQTDATLTLPGVSAADAGSYTLVASNNAGSVTTAPATLTVLPGQTVSVSIKGFENVRTIAANGGQAGHVRVGGWNEIGYNSNAGSVSSLVNHKGQTNNMAVAWSAGTNRRWNGPFAFAGDHALFNGFIETNVTVVISNIPAAFQAAGYDLYVYMGEPNANLGKVEPFGCIGLVTDGVTTNFYHAIDLAVWDGAFVPATTTNPFDIPADANYTRFAGLTAESVTVSALEHPSYLGGPVSISGFQIVANVPALTPTTLNIDLIGGNPVLTWEGPWILQQKSALDGLPTGWSDVNGATSPYQVPGPLQSEQYFRLREP